jgi:hypothetical protein
MRPISGKGELLMTNQPQISRGLSLARRVFTLSTRSAAALLLAMCLGAGANAQQDPQQGQQQGPPPPDQQQAQPPQQQPQDPPANRPTYAPQDADKPPYSRDHQRQYPPAMQDQQAPQNQPAQPSQPLPTTLTIPSGTILVVRVNDFLSSDKNQIGDSFTATLDQPIVVNGWVVARRGQLLTGKVKEAKKAGRVKGVSQLGVELTDLTVVDGRQLPILTDLSKASAGTSHGQDAATIGTTTGLGALIGSAADWGTGAAIGAGAGAVAGIGAVLLTRGHPTILEPETPLSFRLLDPVTVDTTQSAQAFFPVTQEDYNGGRGYRGPRRVVAGYPGYPYPYAYPYPYYAYPYVGFYGGYGWWGRGYYRGGFYGGHFRH